MKEFFYNKRNIVILALFILFFIGFIFLIPIDSYDEVWNFQNVYKMYNNYTLYSDANVIITPIFFYLALGFFKFFGSTMLSFRLFNIFIFGIYFIVFYYIFKKLKTSKHINILFLSIILMQISPIVNAGANYNALSSLFILVGILSYLHLYEKKYFHYLQGFIIFLTFFTKQNLGVYYACSILVFEFIHKESFLKFVIQQLQKFVTFIIFLIGSLFAFYINGNLFSFINYCFGRVV